VALFDSGRLGFVNERFVFSFCILRILLTCQVLVATVPSLLQGRRSSPGRFVSLCFKNLVTKSLSSIFHVSCNGTISLRLPDIMQFDFIYHAPSRGILGRPSGAQLALNRRSNKLLHNFVRRTEQAVDEVVPDSWAPFNFLVGPFKVSDRDQIGFQPRCPSKPFGLESFVKPGARPASFNGCGAENGMKVPDYRFTECCDNHDLCYGQECFFIFYDGPNADQVFADDCSMTWSQCNDNFRGCMHNQCNQNEPTWSEWGCNNLADAYADMVGTRLGAWSFSNSNADRCACGCPAGTANCTDMCLRDCRERCNFVDCSIETSSSMLTRSTSSSKTSSSSTGSSALITTTRSSPTVTVDFKITSQILSTEIAPLTPTPSGSRGAACPGDEASDSWWPFDFWSTTTCPDKNSTYTTPREGPANAGYSKLTRWPSIAWFTTTNSPPPNETVVVSSMLRTETTIWWWPFL
jgi:hypothetical protein